MTRVFKSGDGTSRPFNRYTYLRSSANSSESGASPQLIADRKSAGQDKKCYYREDRDGGAGSGA